MSTRRQTQRKEPTPDQICFHFQWLGPGLTIQESPAHLEIYALPAVLQQSLWAAQNHSPPNGDDFQGNPAIPVGSLAQMLHRAPWGNLSLNFEPGPGMELMLYMSLDAIHLDYRSAPMTVEFAANGEHGSPIPFKRGQYSSPALAPGRYVFAVAQAGAALTEVVLRLDGSGDSPPE